MTVEESIKWIDEEIRWENECQSKHPIKEALYEARKALEQKSALDKIRAEIKAMSGDIETIADVLQIIDKYKVESEVKANGNEK